jgi:hypothetical protein
VAGDARAVGGILSTPRDPAAVVEARYAIAISKAQTTRWASLRVERFPGAMAWLIPVRPGARISETSDAWFEALEAATAVRVVGPTCGPDAGAPPVHVERPTAHEPSAPALHVTDIDGVAHLHSFAQEWAFDLPAAIEERFATLEGRGFHFVAMVYGGAVDRVLTRTVRVTDDAFPAVPLFLTSGPSSARAVRIAAFFIAETRARVGSGSEEELDAKGVSFADGKTNYDQVLLSELSVHRGASWIVEASDHAFFFGGARGPAGTEPTPPISETYVARAADYGDPLDDLSLSLSGLDSTKAWITRVAGIVPEREFGDDLAVTLGAAQAKSPFVVAGRTASCPVPEAGAPSMPPVSPGPDAGPSPPPPPIMTTTGTGSSEGPPRGTPPRGTSPGQGPAPAGEAIESGSDGFGCSCSWADDGSGSGDSCDHSDSTDSSSSDGCSGSSDDSSDSSSDGCDSSSDSSDSSDDGGGCGSSSSDSSDDSGGCDSSGSGSSSSDSSDSGGGCDSSSSSSDSSSDSKCAVTRRPHRRRSRTSAFAFAIAAIVLPLRRLGRARSNARVLA